MCLVLKFVFSYIQVGSKDIRTGLCNVLVSNVTNQDLDNWSRDFMQIILHRFHTAWLVIVPWEHSWFSAQMINKVHSSVPHYWVCVPWFKKLHRKLEHIKPYSCKCNCSSPQQILAPSCLLFGNRRKVERELHEYDFWCFDRAVTVWDLQICITLDLALCIRKQTSKTQQYQMFWAGDPVAFCWTSAFI